MGFARAIFHECPHPTPAHSTPYALVAEAFLQDVSREYYSSHAGLKPAAVLQPIYERHREAFGDESLDLAMARLKGSKPGSEEHRSGRMLVEWLMESRVGRELAPLEEREIAWEGGAVVRLPDGLGGGRFAGRRSPIANYARRERASRTRQRARLARRGRACSDAARPALARERACRAHGDCADLPRHVRRARRRLRA